MKTTLDKLLKACLNTRLEIVRFKAGWIHEETGGEGDMASRVKYDWELDGVITVAIVFNFLQEISNTLLDMHDRVVELKEELEK